MRPRGIHVKIWRKWVGPRGRKTQTGPFAFYRPRHHEFCPDKPPFEGPGVTIRDKKGKPIRQWYTECLPDDFVKF